MDCEEVPYRYTVALADVEAVDTVFCDKFTQGDQEKFLALCASSVFKTQDLLRQTSDMLGLKGELVASSFFTEFGREEFLRVQNIYQETLTQHFESNSSFKMRVFDDLLRRMDLYRKMYDGLLPAENQEREDFLVQRTIRTMAQYLTLGRLIGDRSEHPAIVCHPTRNIGMFNARNKFLLPTDGNQPQPTIPVFEMKKRVY